MTIDDACKAALLEDELQHKNKIKTSEAVWDIMAHSLVQPYTTSFIVNVNDEPVSFDTFESGTDGVFSTKGSYGIIYYSKSSKNYRKGCPFCIGQDLVRMPLYVGSPKHLHFIANKIPEIGWLLRNSTYSDELFDIAAKHPGMRITFTIDWVRYAKMIEKKAKDMGLDIDNKPYVCFKCSFQDFENKYKFKRLAREKGVVEYKKEIEEINKEVIKD